MGKRVKSEAELERLDKLAQRSRQPRKRKSPKKDRVRGLVLEMEIGSSITVKKAAEVLEMDVGCVRLLFGAIKKEGLLQKKGSPKHGITWYRVNPEDSGVSSG